MICDECKVEDELILASWKEYRVETFPVCSCGRRMRRDWSGGGRITHQSKGRFGFVTQNMGDGPQRVDDYQDLQRKLKARGLHVAEPTAESNYFDKHCRDFTHQERTR